VPNNGKHTGLENYVNGEPSGARYTEPLSCLYSLVPGENICGFEVLIGKTG
jgi:hypothetical protein